MRLAQPEGALERLTEFLASASPVPVGDALSNDALAGVVDVAAADPGVVALIEQLQESPTSFCVYDFELYPRMFLRGKGDGLTVVGDDEICLGRNGGGDIYLWSAKTGRVRFLIHDQGWRVGHEAEGVDAFVERVMYDIVEMADADQIEEADDDYLMRFAFALELAAESVFEDEVLDDDVAEALRGRGLGLPAIFDED
ncbi:MAG: hypothetical protein KC731_35000 [Myxococcales bacterium]|nr:hypothetical protein [Myxococcales bacterium]